MLCQVCTRAHGRILSLRVLEFSCSMQCLQLSYGNECPWIRALVAHDAHRRQER